MGFFSLSGVELCCTKSSAFCVVCFAFFFCFVFCLAVSSDLHIRPSRIRVCQFIVVLSGPRSICKPASDFAAYLVPFLLLVSPGSMVSVSVFPRYVIRRFLLCFFFYSGKKGLARLFVSCAVHFNSIYPCCLHVSCCLGRSFSCFQPHTHTHVRLDRSRCGGKKPLYRGARKRSIFSLLGIPFLVSFQPFSCRPSVLFPFSGAQ